jgi:hypothetical protein
MLDACAGYVLAARSRASYVLAARSRFFDFFKYDATELAQTFYFYLFLNLEFSEALNL